MDTTPKYALPEIERRWRVDLAAVGALDESDGWRIEDRYLDGGRMRLRAMYGPGGEAIYKLCKKYGKRSPLTEPITNLYLSAEEHAALSALPGADLVKRRYKMAGGSLDLIDGVALFEKEFADEDEARAYTPPAFVGEEVTGDPAWTCAALARGGAPCSS